MFVSRPLYPPRPEPFRFNWWSLVPLFFVLGVFTGLVTGMLQTLLPVL
jgi:hypothetical protein